MLFLLFIFIPFPININVIPNKPCIYFLNLQLIESSKKKAVLYIVFFNKIYYNYKKFTKKEKRK